jgi:hypothetical protein
MIAAHKPNPARCIHIIVGFTCCPLKTNGKKAKGWKKAK